MIALWLRREEYLPTLNVREHFVLRATIFTAIIIVVKIFVYQARFQHTLPM